jgi:hypothetical protein
MANSVRISHSSSVAQATWVARNQEDQGSRPAWAKKPMRLHLNNSWEWRCVSVILAMQGSANRNIKVYVSLGIKWDSISKTSNNNGLVEWLKWSSSSLTNAKCKAVSSHCSTISKKKKKTKAKNCHRPHTFHDFIGQFGPPEVMWLQSGQCGVLNL